MHELAIAESIVEGVTRHAQECRAQRVTSVRVQIGEACGIVSDSLAFSFEMIANMEPLLSGAKRVIERLRLGVIEGDVETAADAERIAAAGGESVQIITQGACHLEAHMVRAALAQLDLDAIDMLIVENIGNLVCPAGWDLGEDLKAVVVSTTEGDDKPAKYPHMFAASQIMIINKIDLLPYVDYDLSAV